jgi:hypothetical protein
MKSAFSMKGVCSEREIFLIGIMSRFSFVTVIVKPASKEKSFL